MTIFTLKKKCLKCINLKQRISIDSPEILAKTIHMIKENIVNGVITENAYWPKEQIKFDSPSFLSLSKTGPWPDVLQYYFSCSNCLTLFCLQVNCYHGLGGEWVAVT